MWPNAAARWRSPSAFICARSRSSSSISAATILSDMSILAPSAFAAAIDALAVLVEAHADLVRSDRLVVIPSLAVVAAGTAHEVGLGLGLDALGGAFHVHRPRDRDARGHHRQRAAVEAGIDHHRAVELELLEAEVAQEPDR